MNVKFNYQFRKFIYEIILVGMILSLLFGAGGTPIAHAREEQTETLKSQATQTLSIGNDLVTLALPSFKWPWDSSENGNIKWTSGPHSWSKGGQFSAKISSTRGSGLDFAKNGLSFTVLSMAPGTVIKNKCGFSGLGCIVAIKHDVGGSVMIYAHLQYNANNTGPLNNLQEGVWYSQGTIIGYAGNTGGSWPVHLHIEFRDGASSCTATASGIDGNDCGDIGWAGNPIGWDGKQLVDSYYINGYFDSENYCGPGADCDTIFNYDGSAVKGSIAAPFLNFPYLDNGIPRHVEAFVSPNDWDFFTGYCPSHDNCEINRNYTVFADQGKFSGGGGIIYSTNSELQPKDTIPPTGSWTSPSNSQTISSRSVTLSVNASDNSGGSGVKEVRFSAMWGGTWRGLGIASSSPYSLSWDMCNSGVPDGDIELGFEVWDNANNKWVYSEHYTNYHINKSYTCIQNPNDTTPPTGSWTSPGNGQTISSQNVTLSVNASDNSGGSGVREVRWSAKFNNQWYGVGSDTTSPYSTNWDMCASGVPNGDVELGFEVWDNSNNKWVYSEHYTNYHINKSYTCNGNTSGSWETWGWQNKYLAGYDNWHGTLTWDNYPYIWWDFGSGGPFGWGGNEFSLRMQRDVYFPGGDYSFHVDHDDGARVWVDGNLLIDSWWDGNGGHDGGRNLSQGNHQVKVEYYENQGDALIHVLWYGPGYPRPDNNPPDGRITSPADHSATASSPLTITADASDDASGVNRVEFYVWYCSGSCDWHQIGISYSSPYSVTWDWASLSDQHVYLTTHIVDNTGKVKEDPGGYVEVDLDRTKPSVSITSPIEGTYLTDIVPILVSANDSLSGVAKVQFIVGYNDAAGVSLQSIPEPPPPATRDENGMIIVQDIGAQDYWKEIGWDNDGTDGWSINWNTTGVPEQSGIAVFAYVYDKAWNYEGAVRWNMLLFRQPSNDDINSPIQINSNPYANQQHTNNATSAADDPALTDCNRAPGIATVWYTYTPPAAGQIKVDTIGSDYDTLLAIWTGTRGNLNLIACNDDRPSDVQSELKANVASGTTYYVEVSSYNGPINTGASAADLSNKHEIIPAQSVSGGLLKLNAQFEPFPAAPVLLSPSGTITDTHPPYSWNASSGATAYTLAVYSVGSASYIILSNFLGSSCTGGVCTYHPSTNLPFGSYRFKVRAYNAAGSSPYSAWMSFIVSPSAPPDPPTPKSPSGTITDTHPPYRWDSLSNASSYRLAVWSVGSAGYIIITEVYPSSCTAGVCTYHPATVLPEGAYRFKVLARNLAGSSAYGAWMNFTVLMPPDAPAPISPDGTTSDYHPPYRWTASSGAASYRLAVYSEDSASYVILIDVASSYCSAGVCTYHPSIPLSSGSYRFKVLARNAAGVSPYSTWMNFTISP